MVINTQEDWWALAKQTIPLLPDYAAEFDLIYLEDTANALVEAKNHSILHYSFERLWSDLPDRSIIRHGPFFDLCDLCSEYWVFTDEESGDA